MTTTETDLTVGTRVRVTERPYYQTGGPGDYGTRHHLDSTSEGPFVGLSVGDVGEVKSYRDSSGDYVVAFDGYDSTTYINENVLARVSAEGWAVGDRVTLTAPMRWISAGEPYEPGQDSDYWPKAGMTGTVHPHDAWNDGRFIDPRQGNVSVRFEAYGPHNKPVTWWVDPSIMTKVNEVPATAAPVRAFEVGDRVMVVDEPVYRSSMGTLTTHASFGNDIRIGDIVEVSDLWRHDGQVVVKAVRSDGSVDPEGPGYIVTPEVIALLDVETEDVTEPTPDQSAEVERLMAEVDRLKREHQAFRVQVAEAVMREAVERDWCSEAEGWLSELGLEGLADRPVEYPRGSVALLDDGRVAIRFDDDDEPWHVFNARGYRDQYATDKWVRDNLRTMLSEGPTVGS